MMMKNKILMLVFLFTYGIPMCKCCAQAQEITIIMAKFVWMTTPFDITPSYFDKGYIKDELDTVVVSNESEKNRLMNVINNAKEDGKVGSFNTRGKIIISNSESCRVLYFAPYQLTDGNKRYEVSNYFGQLIDEIFYIAKRNRPFSCW